MEGRRLRWQRLLGLASLGWCGPTVPALRGPLTQGYSKGALPGECCGNWSPWAVVELQPEAGGQLGVARATESGGWHPWAPRSGAALYLEVSVEACRPYFAAGSDCMWIHAGTLGTLLREVARSPSGHDQVFVPGKKYLENRFFYIIYRIYI